MSSRGAFLIPHLARKECENSVKRQVCVDKKSGGQADGSGAILLAESPDYLL